MYPLFFVSVASKGFSFGVSHLFATLAGRFISVAAKGVTQAMYWRDSNVLEWEDFGGVRRTTWRAPIRGQGPPSAGRHKNHAESTKQL
jgi:hypothetical protein